jgi:V8-like Glu-specific endopeptidase
MRLMIALVLMSLLLPTLSQDTITPKTIETIQRSVFPIVCVEKRIAEGRETFHTKLLVGTGFFINRKGDFMTAAHIPLDLKWLTVKENCFEAIQLTKVPWKERANDTQLKWFAITESQYNKEADVAVGHLRLNPFDAADISPNITPVTFTDFSKYADGSPVAFTGFPLQSVYPVTSKGSIASYIPSQKLFAIDKNVWPGASGSPVYDSEGKVIGLIIKGGINEGAGLAYARSTDYILDFLRANKIPTEN